MADQERSGEVNLRKSEPIGERSQFETADYLEETSAEFTAPNTYNRNSDREVRDNERESGGRGIAYTALALSIISLFVWPIFFGAIGIVLGFIARRRGSGTLGAWAIGIGAVAIIIGVFILPFF
ncbi:DUF4190 domain-containing protein [Bacillus sp. 03113]|uniref:DUF4190 domain-containing protein n=1 Tax=Bacillus sp. 03113 TaxID=2578211 RepID=UPI0011420DA5|nr:DUF4190 domain-containing protein [Bacillus sp. 03113]